MREAVKALVFLAFASLFLAPQLLALPLREEPTAEVRTQLDDGVFDGFVFAEHAYQSSILPLVPTTRWDAITDVLKACLLHD